MPHVRPPNHKGTTVHHLEQERTTASHRGRNPYRIGKDAMRSIPNCGSCPAPAECAVEGQAGDGGCPLD